VRHHLQQSARGQDACAFGERGLRRISFRKHEGAAGAPRGQCHGKRAAHRAQLSVER
jgi:hypothetical protein